MSTLKELLKRPLVSNLRILILLTNLVYIASILLRMFMSNPGFFLENAFQTINLFFYPYVLLSHLLIKNVKLYFLSSFLLILDLPFNLRPMLQNFLVDHLNIAGIFSSQLMIHLLLLLILGVLIFAVYKYCIAKYLQIFLLFFYIVSFVMIAFQTKRIYTTPLKMASPVNTISKNYYFLLFDEYPGEAVIKQYHLCDTNNYPSAILLKEGFTGDQNIYSNYISTIRSTTNVLTGSLQATYNVNNTIQAMTSNVFSPWFKLFILFLFPIR